jgi:hypothetical protein
VPNQSSVVPTDPEKTVAEVLAFPSILAASKSPSAPMTQVGAACQLNPAWPPPKNPLEVKDEVPLVAAVMPRAGIGPPTVNGY